MHLFKIKTVFLRLESVHFLYGYVLSSQLNYSANGHSGKNEGRNEMNFSRTEEQTRNHN
jgi:hypothetical protein